MKIILLIVISVTLSAFGAENDQNFASLREVIRKGLREGKLEIDTPFGRYIHPQCNHEMKYEDPMDPKLGPSIKILDEESIKVIRAWINENNPKWVAIIVPADTPGGNFIQLCSILREHDIGHTSFDAEEIEGRKFTSMTIISGNYSNIRFSKSEIHIPTALPIAPKDYRPNFNPKK